MRLIEIFEGTLFQAQMVKNLLDNEGIESYLKDETIGTRGGEVWRPAGGVRVIISDFDYDRAKKIVDKFDN
jgi:hypothetical protein